MTPTDAWSFLERTTAPIVLRRKALGEKWTEISSAIRDKLRAKFGDAPLTYEMPAYLTVGRR